MPLIKRILGLEQRPCEHDVDGTLAPVDGHVCWRCQSCGELLDRRETNILPT